jgi:type III pantothenate kinase
MRPGLLLTIDSGNTNVVFAVYDGDERRGEWRSASDPQRTADDYAVWLTQLMALEGLTLAAVDAAIIANVVPATAYGLESLCRHYFDTEPLLVGEAGVELGIRVLVPNPAEVGEDRLVNAVAAHTRYPGTKIIIDFGTATTFDVIAPGINLSLEALHMAAARLPRIGVRRPDTVIGRSTIPAMQSGIYWGYTGLIEGLVARIRGEYGDELVTVIATGGLAVLFDKATDVIDHVDPDLTIRGLVEIHRRNRGT